MTIEETFIKIVKQIEHSVIIKDVREWDGEIPFVVHVPLEYPEHEYYVFIAKKIMLYTGYYDAGKIKRYEWKKYLMASFILIASVNEIDI